MEFLEEYSKENDFNIVTYETTRNKENDALLSKVRQALNNNDKQYLIRSLGQQV